MRARYADRRYVQRRRGRRGSTTLEFAVLLPVLLTVALLAVDYGRIAHHYIAVTNAARAGAGFGMMHPVTDLSKPIWDAGIRNAVEQEMSANFWYESEQLTMPEPQIIDEGDGLLRAQVEVTYPFETLINWPFLPGYNEPIQLRRVVVMRLIRS